MAMRSVLLSARAIARPSARRELAQALSSWAGAARLEPGVLASSVFEDVEVPGTFRFEAEWTDAAALDGHLRSPDFGVLLGAMELLASPVRMTVLDVVEEYGPEPLPPIRRLRESHRVDAVKAAV
jgi:quinol monooxygenase YgiN